MTNNNSSAPVTAAAFESVLIKERKRVGGYVLSVIVIFILHGYWIYTLSPVATSPFPIGIRKQINNNYYDPSSSKAREEEEEEEVKMAAFIAPTTTTTTCRVRQVEHEEIWRENNAIEISFPWTIDNVTFLNYPHFHFKHCPYTASYINNSYPPRFHKFCQYDTSRLEWKGFCVQKYEFIRNLTGDDDGEPDEITMLFKDCKFVPSDFYEIVNKSRDSPSISRSDP